MIHTVSAELAGRTHSFENGKVAAQANGAVVARYGDTVVLATATSTGRPREGIDFFPLTIDYEERLYAVGKIPGSFFRREGRPGTEAILDARLTDRPLRPLFPKGFRNEVQVIITVLSADQENDPDTLGTIAASAALSISDIPFEGPVSSVRVGYIGGEYVVNPTFAQLADSELDLVVASTKDAVVMVEAGASCLPEDTVLGAIMFAHRANGEVIALQEELVRQAGRPKREWRPLAAPVAVTERETASAEERPAAQAGDEARGLDDEAEAAAEAADMAAVVAGVDGGAPAATAPTAPVYEESVAVGVDLGAPAVEVAPVEQGVDEAVAEVMAGKLDQLLAVAKDERSELLFQRRQELVDHLGDRFPQNELYNALERLMKKTVRAAILNEGRRADGRGPKDIRPISCEVGVLPRTHGSGLFTRGQTQVLTIATLGSQSMEQKLDTLSPDDTKRYIHHYNFPPFSVGEVRRLGSPGRR